MTTTSTPSRGRRVAALAAAVLSVIVAVGAAVLILPAGEQPEAAGADPTTTSTTAAPTTTTTLDPVAVLAAWYQGLTPEEQLAFRLYAGTPEDRAAFAQLVTPTTTTTAPPTTTTTAPPPPPPAPEPAPAPAPEPAPAPAPAVSTGPANAFLACVVRRESGGNYQAVNGSSGAGGAYQFLQSTWNNTASHAGRPDLVGVHPSQASPADQDAMAAHLLSWYGPSPWAGPGC